MMKPGQTAKQFVMQPVAAVLPVLSYAVRGVSRVKPEGGKLRLQVDPGKSANVMFFKCGQPHAVAVIQKVSRDMGDWIVEYAGVKWLSEVKPDE